MRWRPGPGGRVEPDHLPLPVFRGIGRAGDGDFELLSRIWVACVNAGVLEFGFDSVFHRGGLEILQESGDFPGGWRVGGGSPAIPDPGAVACTKRNEIRIWNIVLASRV